MAIKKCRECGHDVSTQAKSCPNCGAVRPVKHSPAGGLAVLSLVVVGAIFFSQGESNSNNGDDESGSARNEITDEECMQDIQCWRDRVFSSARYDCEKAIESLSSYSFQWTDGFLESRFSHMRWLDQESGKITFIGDKIEYQNGFGAYQAHIYECDYDPAENTVIDVTARPGRL